MPTQEQKIQAATDKVTAKRFGLKTQKEVDRVGRFNYYLGALAATFVTVSLAQRDVLGYHTVAIFAGIFLVIEIGARLGAVLISKLHDRYLIRKENKAAEKKKTV